MISDNILTIFFFQDGWMWLGVMTSQDGHGGVQRWSGLTFSPTVSFQFALLHSLPWSKHSHSFSFCHLQEGELFFSCRNEKVSFTLDQVSASLFPKPRPLCSSETWTGEGGNERSDHSFSPYSPHGRIQGGKDGLWTLLLPSLSLWLRTAPTNFPPSDTSKAASGTRVYAKKHMLP